MAWTGLRWGLQLGLGPWVMVRIVVQATILFPENSLWRTINLEVLQIKNHVTKLLPVAIIFATLQSKHRHKRVCGEICRTCLQ